MHSRVSTNTMAATTSTPASAPITTAEGVLTKAQNAVIATIPASIPLHSIVTSGLPKRAHTYVQAASAPAADASIVFVATTVMRESVPASATRRGGRSGLHEH